MPKGKQFLKKGKPGIKYNTHYGMSDYYQFYLEQVDTLKANEIIIKNNNIVDKHTFNKITTDFNEMFVQKVLQEGIFTPLPYNFGHIGIRKKKVPFHQKNRLRMNWEVLKETGLKVMFTNDHTNNYYYKIVWWKPKAPIPSKRLYSYIPVRYFKRVLGKLLKGRITDYPEDSRVKLTNEQKFMYAQMRRNNKVEIHRLVQEYKDKYNI